MRPRLFALVVTTLSLLPGCNAIFGWDEAQLDQDADVTSEQPLASESCQRYCDSMMSGCLDEQLEYRSGAVCLEMCMNLSNAVAPGDNYNPIACRSSYARRVSEEPEVYCRAAGLLSGEACGEDICAAFCVQALAVCADVASPPFSDFADCRAACTEDFYYNDTVGMLSQPFGNTLNCRIFHLQKAFDGAAERNCPNVGRQSVTCQ